jgi:hypothetical protein
VPELDRVAVRIVIDSYQFAVAPSRKLPNLDVQHFGWGLSDKPPRRTLVSEFGLATHVESRRGNETRNILVDFGFTPEALSAVTMPIALTQPRQFGWQATQLNFIGNLRSSRPMRACAEPHSMGIRPGNAKGGGAEQHPTSRCRPMSANRG